MSHLAAEIAGVIGGLLSLSFIERLTLVVALTALVCAIASAYYFTPVILELTGWPKSWAGPVGFVLGVTGFVLVSGIHTVAHTIKDWLPGVVRRFLDRKAGG